MDRDLAESLISLFQDLFESQENSFRNRRQLKVMARVVQPQICPFTLWHGFLCLDESVWPISNLFVTLLKKIVNCLSKMEVCSFLI